jgi:hypothetical protein
MHNRRGDMKSNQDQETPFEDLMPTINYMEKGGILSRQLRHGHPEKPGPDKVVSSTRT